MIPTTIKMPNFVKTASSETSSVRSGASSAESNASASSKNSQIPFFRAMKSLDQRTKRAFRKTRTRLSCSRSAVEDEVLDLDQFSGPRASDVASRIIIARVRNAPYRTGHAVDNIYSYQYPPPY